MEPNRSSGLLLHEGRISIGYRERAKDCLCRITFDMNRDQYVLVDCLESLHELLPPTFSASEPFNMLLPGSSKPVEGYIAGSFTQTIVGGDPSVYVTLWTQGPPSIERGNRLSRVQAVIVNLRQYRCGPGDEIHLSDGAWDFELTPVRNSSEYPSEIQNKSYLISHLLVLKRHDAHQFSWTQACKCLEAFCTFLSFCSERTVAPALVRGLDNSGEMIVQDLRTPRVDPFTENVSWLDLYHGSAMMEVFPGFMRLMGNEEWRQAIHTAVYWYVRGNTNLIGPDGAVVLIQTALERIAWHILVKVRHSVADYDFSALPAAAQFRLVLDSCSIPLALPSRLTKLTGVSKGKKGEKDWLDGPEAFVAVRNQIVHPVKRKRVSGGLMFYEALQLGKWYLELILLHSCGFAGNYACRLDIPICQGSVEPLPWAKS